MKRTAAILLILCLVFQTFRQSALLTTYEWNRELIVELFCVNKEKVEMQCHASCFMKAQLGKEDPQKAPNSEPAIEAELKLFLPLDSVRLLNIVAARDKNQIPSSLGTEQSWNKPLFHPPQIS